MVGMGDGAPRRWSATPDRHLQGIHDELGTHVIGDGPAHHHPTERLEHHGQVELAVAGGMLGHVHHPQPIRPHRVEHPVDQVLSRLGGQIAAGATAPATPIDASDASLAHQPRHPLATTTNTFAEAQRACTRGDP
jgi:hypothetical protein